MEDVYIVSAVRTAIGSFGGSLKPLLSNELGVIVAKEAIKRAGIEDPGIIEDVLIGNCFMRSDEINVARVISLKADIPFTTPASTIQRQCASGMQAMAFAVQKIQTGEADVVMAGGVESMSNVPFILKDMRWGAGYRHVQATDGLAEGLSDPIDHILMGETAERLADKYDITREDMDEVALMSQDRALAAIDNGWFKEEIVPVPVPQRRGDPKMFDTDEHPRRGTTMETLGKLRAVFRKEGGRVTAGNASGINDGAAVTILMSGSKVKELGLKPLARIVGHAVAAVEPDLMGYGPVPAINKLMKRLGRNIHDIPIVEVNEAFAAQYIACEKLLELDREKTNLVGSGIALGHPVGATGCRLIVTLLHQMKRLGLKEGVASMCVGGGMGKAMMIELV